MKKIFILIKAFFFLMIFAVLSFSFSGCAGKSVDDGNPAEIYEDAEQDIKSDRYLIAIDKLRVVKNKHPYSSFATKAQLRIADVYFMQESYIEAAAAYETFRDLHPKHEQAAYAAYRIGESYFNDIPGNIARDQVSAKKSLEAMVQFISQYPNHPDVVKTRERINEVRSILASKELYVANFYYKQNDYEAARGRYKKILEMYPETKAFDEAKEKLKKIEEKLTRP